MGARIHRRQDVGLLPPNTQHRRPVSASGTSDPVVGASSPARSGRSSRREDLEVPNLVDTRVVLVDPSIELIRPVIVKVLDRRTIAQDKRWTFALENRHG